MCVKLSSFFFFVSEAGQREIVSAPVSIHSGKGYHCFFFPLSVIFFSPCVCVLCVCLRACEYRTDSHQLFFFFPRGKEVESVSSLFVSVCLCVFSFFFEAAHIHYILLYTIFLGRLLCYSLCVCVCVCVSFCCCSYCFLTSDCSLLSPLPRCLDEGKKKTVSSYFCFCGFH